MIEMPTYIEREALWRAMQSIIEDPTCPLHIAATVYQYITEAPAADVVERKRGEWVWKTESKLDEHTGEYWGEEYCSCPFCGKDSDWEHNFCPNCGADMRGDPNDHP